MLTLTKSAPRAAAKAPSSKTRKVLGHLAVEAAVLLPLVVVYFLLVMHAMGDFLTQMHRENLRLYAGLSVALLVGQSVVLDGISGRILAWLGHERDE